ncbi:Ribosomal protein L9/RNase H1, N-terminal [Sesbania bispinosa]|nr:Ribosomal protein L9/RNase H1, N-terminal [Sesbania bispinosa]
MAMRGGSQRSKMYVVFVGRQPGFYSSWSECQVQVNGFSGSLYQAYNTREEANSAWIRLWSTSNMHGGRLQLLSTRGSGRITDPSGSNTMGFDMDDNEAHETYCHG